MTKRNSIKIVELYPEMFTFTVRDYKHNIFEKAYNKVLTVVHRHFKFTRSINYIKQTNPYQYTFGIGDGWYKLVYDLVHDIRINDLKKGDWITKVTQCKEKFGGLRFYVTGTSDKNWALIRNAEQKSYAVCEATGSEVEVGTWNDGWVQTICHKEALRRFYDKSDKGELNGKRFEDCWKPSVREHVIETPKKKKK
jgi:hypothetical protein